MKELITAIENKLDHATAMTMDAMDTLDRLKENIKEGDDNLSCEIHIKPTKKNGELEEVKMLLHARLYRVLAMVSNMIAAFESTKEEATKDDINRLKEQEFILENITMLLEDFQS